MKTLNPPLESNLCEDALSADLYKRAVELAFLERVLNRMTVRSANALKAANEWVVGDRLQIETQAVLEAMKNPVFAEIARAMEANVDVEAGFGKFRGGK